MPVSHTAQAACNNKGIQYPGHHKFSMCLLVIPLRPGYYWSGVAVMVSQGELRSCLDCCKDLVKRLWYNSSFRVTRASIHCVCLASTSLAIRKHGAIVAFQNTVYNWLGSLAVHSGLCAVPVKDIVKGESFRQLSRPSNRLHYDLPPQTTFDVHKHSAAEGICRANAQYGQVSSADRGTCLLQTGVNFNDRPATVAYL